eukprot:GHVP01037573.1.p1 GENE.GHVP01037573.1~~GHVP01037573.1.p1  ORF type:complete len:255 (+),score=23.05 GHVP01037573.1:133-897(+)
MFSYLTTLLSALGLSQPHRMLEGPKKAFCVVDFVTRRDLRSFHICRDLDKLTLGRGAVYLLRYITGQPMEFVSIKKLLISSSPSYRQGSLERYIEKDIEKDHKKAHLVNVYEVEAHGSVSISQLLFGVSIHNTIQRLILHSKDIAPFGDIERLTNKPAKINFLYHKEFHINGLISLRIIKALYEGSGCETEYISIKCTHRHARSIRETQWDGIINNDKLKRLTLHDGRVYWLFLGLLFFQNKNCCYCSGIYILH